MIKRFHEAPKSIFKKVQELTDGDYFLVHLFETDPEYFQLAKEAVAAGREVILDSSTFELGKAFDMERYAYWIEELNPTYYVIPDALDDTEKTKSLANRWISLFAPSLPGHMIGVVQGKNYEECAHLYMWLDRELDPEDKIALSFDSKWYEQAYPHPNKLVSWCYGRIFFINRMIRDGIINPERKVHLLGCSLPIEFAHYREKEHSFIDSVDTSNPVSVGMEGIEYGRWGMTRKPEGKMCDMMDYQIEPWKWDDIKYNIYTFADICNKDWF